MGLQGRLRHLQKQARGRFSWLELPNGSSFFYDPERTAIELFSYAAGGYRAAWKGEAFPPAPGILKVIGGLPSREAREKVFEAVYAGSSNPFVAYDAEVFLESGEIKPHPSLKRKPGGEPPDEGGVVRIGMPPAHLR